MCSLMSRQFSTIAVHVDGLAFCSKTVLMEFYLLSTYIEFIVISEGPRKVVKLVFGEVAFFAQVEVVAYPPYEDDVRFILSLLFELL